MAEHEDARYRLGRLVRDARIAQGLSVRKAAQKAGVDRATWAGIEDGTRATRDTKVVGVERTLHWEQGSVAAILAGGDPASVDETLPAGASTQGVDDPVALIIDANAEELFAMYRTVEADPGYGPLGAEKWLLNALKVRDAARQRRGDTKRDDL